MCCMARPGGARGGGRRVELESRLRKSGSRSKPAAGSATAGGGGAAGATGSSATNRVVGGSTYENDSAAALPSRGEGGDAEAEAVEARALVRILRGERRRRERGSPPLLFGLAAGCRPLVRALVGSRRRTSDAAATATTSGLRLASLPRRGRPCVAALARPKIAPSSARPLPTSNARRPTRRNRQQCLATGEFARLSVAEATLEPFDLLRTAHPSAQRRLGQFVSACACASFFR